MLDEAEIGYVVGNELTSASRPMGYAPSNMEIDIKVEEENLKAAYNILQSIK